jgi:hypothetical protein
MEQPFLVLVDMVLQLVAPEPIALRKTYSYKNSELVDTRTVREFTSTEVVYGVTGTDVTELPEYGVSP